MRNPLPLLLTTFLLCPALSIASQDSSSNPSASTSQILEIAWINGEHTDLDSEIAPIRRGPLLLAISSPSHVLTIHSNRLALTPVAGEKAGTLDIELDVDFEGSGDLEIILHTDAGKGATFEDQVTAPRQSVNVRARAHFQASPNGYVVTLIEAPTTVVLDMESKLAEQLTNSCNALATFLGLDCTGLSDSLSVATVPLPKAGTKFFVDGERFTPREKAVLNELISP